MHSLFKVGRSVLICISNIKVDCAAFAYEQEKNNSTGRNLPLSLVAQQCCNNSHTHTHRLTQRETAWLAVFMNENANSCRSLATCRMRNARRAATVGGRKIKRRVNWRRLAGGAVGCQHSTWSCATGNTNTPPHLASSLLALSVTLCVKNIISLAARRARRQ